MLRVGEGRIGGSSSGEDGAGDTTKSFYGTKSGVSKFSHGASTGDEREVDSEDGDPYASGLYGRVQRSEENRTISWSPTASVL